MIAPNYRCHGNLKSGNNHALLTFFFQMLMLEKVENLREEAEDVLDGIENPKTFMNQSLLP